MADTELKGTIKLGLDVTEAKQDAKDFAKDAGQSIGKEVSAGVGRMASGGAPQSFSEAMGKALSQRLTQVSRRFGLAGDAVRSFLGTRSGAATPAAGGGFMGIAGSLGQSALLNAMRQRGMAGAGFAGMGGTMGQAALQAGAGQMAGSGAGGGAGAGILAMAKAHPVALVAAAVVIGLAAMGKALEKSVSKLQTWGRELAQSSGRMSATMAVFDLRMMLINKSIGDRLAPAMAKLNNEVIRFQAAIAPLKEALGELALFITTKLMVALNWLVDRLGQLGTPPASLGQKLMQMNGMGGAKTSGIDHLIVEEGLIPLMEWWKKTTGIGGNTLPWLNMPGRDAKDPKRLEHMAAELKESLDLNAKATKELAEQQRLKNLSDLGETGKIFPAFASMIQHQYQQDAEAAAALRTTAAQNRATGSEKLQLFDFAMPKPKPAAVAATQPSQSLGL